MIKVAIDGGPGTGKTSIIKELQKLNYHVVPEVARIFLNMNKYKKNNPLTLSEFKNLQKDIWNQSVKDFYAVDNLKNSKVIFFDRGMISGLSYLARRKVPVSKEVIKQAKTDKYDYIFIVHPLPIDFYARDKVRHESYKVSLDIQKQIIKSYKKFSYKPIIVPFDTVKQRTNFILKRIKKDLKI